MSGRRYPRHGLATQADRDRIGRDVIPGETMLYIPTRSQQRMLLAAEKRRKARTPEQKLAVELDYFRSVLAVARKRHRSRHVPDVPGLDERVLRLAAIVQDMSHEIEHAGRIERGPGKRPL